jgi:RNase P/RNase MRP subunit POP5
MPKKNPGERWRYIAFRIEGEAPLARNDFLNSIYAKAKGSSLGDRFRITVFEDDFGILKVPHFLKADAIGVLSSVDSVRGLPCRVVTLKTSGTIKTLKDKYVKERPAKRRERG